MKKRTWVLMGTMMALALNSVAVFAEEDAVEEKTEEVEETAETEAEEASVYEVQTGISYSDTWGIYLANIVKQDGEVTNVIIDRVKDGQSSKELHDNYGIKPVSSLDKEWWEQAMYYEDWVVENGVEAVETDDDGHALNPDLISGATVNVAEFSEAVMNAQNGVTEAGEYSVKTGIYTDSVWGLYIANILMKGDEVEKVLFDRVANGEDSKEKYDDYGIKPVSSLEKDWWEQVAALEDYATENGIDSITYDEEGHADDPDLISGATIRVDEFALAAEDALN